MNRKRSAQLNVRLRPALAEAFDASLADHRWAKAFVVERLVEAFTQLDVAQRERLMLKARIDTPDFVEHAWRVIGDEALRLDAAAMFEVLVILANATKNGQTDAIWRALEGAKERGEPPADNPFMAVVRPLTFAPVRPNPMKLEVLRGLLLLAGTGLTAAEGVELLRRATAA